MRYKIINPSDDYTLEADDLSVACAATLILGTGMYPLESEDGKEVMPFLGFGGADVWFKEQFDVEFEDFLHERMQDIADCMDSVLIGDFEFRDMFNDATQHMREDERRKYRDTQHDKKRSSENDIGTYAWHFAEKLREKAAETT